MLDRAFLIINLDAIAHNVDKIKATIGHSKLLAVVKADAYGHGAVEVGRFLSAKVDYFGVATVDEGVKLRKSGIDNPILIIGNADKSKYDKIFDYNLIPTIFCLQQAMELSDYASQRVGRIKVHIEIDSGMSRTGFLPNQLDEIIKVCKLPKLSIEGIYSHFACADDQDKSFTKRQYHVFLSVINKLHKNNIDISIKHISNSAGVISHPDCNMNMVRTGLIMYGLYPSDNINKAIDLQPALSFICKIVHIKEIAKGTSVSYSATYTADKTTRVATLSVGYADGYPRQLSSIGRVIIKGTYASIIGRVCMDQMMVDITGIPGVKVGDDAIMIGSDDECKISVDEISQLAGSCNYEIICGINFRVPRVYHIKNQKVKTAYYYDEI